MNASPATVETAGRELAVVTCYFTPQPHARRQRNFEAFRQQFGANLYVAELAYGDAPWHLPAGPNTLHVRGTAAHVLWQKERLLNALIARLPAQFTCVAWVDADILFADPQWTARAVERLRTEPVIQLFDKVVHLDDAGRPKLPGRGLIARAAEIGPSAFAERRGAAGFAWAARRDVLRDVGLLEGWCLGGADSYMAGGFAGVLAEPIMAQLPAPMKSAALAWAERVRKLTQGRVGHLSGTIGHLFHGELQTRGYLQRYELLRRAAFDPATDLFIDATGLHTWKTPKAKFHTEVARYFAWRAAAENE